MEVNSMHSERVELMSPGEIKTLEEKIILSLMKIIILAVAVFFFPKIICREIEVPRHFFTLIRYYNFLLLVLILALCVVTIMNFFKKYKTIYTGVISTKRSKSIFANSPFFRRRIWRITVNDKSFRVPETMLGTVQENDHVEVAFIGYNEVLYINKVVVGINNVEIYTPTEINQQVAMDKWDRDVLKFEFLRKFVYRFVIAFIVCYFLFALNTVLDNKIENNDNINQTVIGAVFLGGFFLLLNIQTFLILLDICLRPDKKIHIETIDELVESSRKTKSRTAYVPQNIRNEANRFYYIRVKCTWLQTDAKTFKTLRLNAPILIHRSKFSEVILQYEYIE